MKNKTTLFFFFLLIATSTWTHPVYGRVINHLGRDATSTFLGWPAVLIVSGGAAALGLTQADQSIQNSFRNSRHMGSFDTALSIAGDFYVVDTGALAVFGIGRYAHNEKLALTGETLLETLFLTETSTGALKLIFQRRRPNGGNYGFPSAHAARTFAAATTLEVLYGPVAGIPSYLFAGLISFSRLDANVHNLSDLVFGAAWGSAIGWGTTRFHRQENPKLFVTPLVGSQAGLAVTGIF